MSIFNDLVALAKAGYTPDNVKEILKLEKESNADADEHPERQRDDGESHTNKKGEDEPDYKSMYEQTKAELDKIQQDNTKKQIDSEELSIEEIIKNIKAEI